MKGSIGIVGGAGPEAGNLLFQSITRTFQAKFGYRKDSDFPHIVLWNYPFEEMLDDSVVLRSKKITKQLNCCIEQLAHLRMSFVTIACNTLHSFLEEESKFKKTRIVRLDQELFKKIDHEGFSKALVLSSNTTRRYNVYKDSVCVYPDMKNQAIVDDFISKTLVGNNLPEIGERFCRFAKDILQKSSSDALILGCTELSLLKQRYASDEFSSIVVLDPLEICAQKICTLSHQEREK